MLTGPLPTPAVAYLTKTFRAEVGIVISASHNPYYDNGIKFFSASGEKLPDEIELAIEAELDKPMTCVSSDLLGKAMRMDDAAGRYIEFCKGTFPSEFSLAGLKLVVDCAHGAAYHIAPAVFSELGAEIEVIGNQPNGLNINDNCGATSLGLLLATVVEKGADLGIAVDGDSDRIMMVDSQGNVIDGDQLLFVLAKDTDPLSSEAVQAALREAETALEVGTETPTGRILLRKSGTEPLIRVMVEAESDAQKWAQHIADQVCAA